MNNFTKTKEEWKKHWDACADSLERCRRMNKPPDYEFQQCAAISQGMFVMLEAFEVVEKASQHREF